VGNLEKMKYKNIWNGEQLTLVELSAGSEINAKPGKVTVYIGDVKKALSLLPAESVDCVVTSPPYWKQRDYKHPDQIGQEDSYPDYIKTLVDVFNEVKSVLKPTGTFFLNVGYKYQNKELLLIPELLAAELQRNGWALLNKIIWNKPNAMPSSVESRFTNVYEPVFLFVRKGSKYKYYFSVDELRLPVSSNFTINKRPEDILGLAVRNTLFKDKKGKREGCVKKVYRTKDGDGCVLALVRWEDGEESLAIVNDFFEKSKIEIDLVYPRGDCKEFPRPKLPSVVDFDDKKELRTSSASSFTSSPSCSYNYKGKYKTSPDNRGASPGARKSLFGEYLVLQRRYKILQPVIADYLRFWRRKSGITTKEIDKLLGYSATAGHWFRKDAGSWGRGGSIPLPDDWFRLKEILGFDDIYDRWVTECHLVLQTVKPHPKGKNPGNVWNIKTQHFPESHFATFPEKLVRRCILAGCPSGGVVLDPFAGSGTTGKVAQDLGREAILIELVPEYLRIIKKRCRVVKVKLKD